MPTAFMVNMALSRKNAPRHRVKSGLFRLIIPSVVRRLTLFSLRGTTSRVLAKQMRYKMMASTPRPTQVSVNLRRTPSAAVSWNCGAMTADRATPVTAEAMERAPDSLERSTGSCVMAADSEP